MTTVFFAQAQISLPLYIFLTDKYHQAHRPCHRRAEKQSAIVRPPSAAGEAVIIGGGLKQPIIQAVLSQTSSFFVQTALSQKKFFHQTALSQTSLFFFNQPGLNVNDGIADGTTALMVAAMLGNDWAITRWGKCTTHTALGQEEKKAYRPDLLRTVSIQLDDIDRLPACKRLGSICWSIHLE